MNSRGHDAWQFGPSIRSRRLGISIGCRRKRRVLPPHFGIYRAGASLAVETAHSESGIATNPSPSPMTLLVAGS